jgi:hypothetical protein
MNNQSHNGLAVMQEDLKNMLRVKFFGCLYSAHSEEYVYSATTLLVHLLANPVNDLAFPESNK